MLLSCCRHHCHHRSCGHLPGKERDRVGVCWLTVSPWFYAQSCYSLPWRMRASLGRIRVRTGLEFTFWLGLELGLGSRLGSGLGSASGWGWAKESVSLPMDGLIQVSPMTPARARCPLPRSPGSHAAPLRRLFPRGVSQGVHPLRTTVSIPMNSILWLKSP